MRGNSAPPEDSTARRQLAVLMLAAMAGIAVLLAVLMAGTEAPFGSAGGAPTTLRWWLIALFGAAGFVAGVIIWRMTTTVQRDARLVKAENQQLRRSLASADAIIRAEPQILIFWEQGQAVRIISRTLTDVPGLPQSDADVLRFGNWLQPSSSRQIKAALNELFMSGRAFNIIVRTAVGASLEAEGRTAGGRAILRLKDITGFRTDLVTIQQQHDGLRSDIAASRALLNAVPMPVWLRDVDGRLTWVNQAYVAAVEAGDEEQVLSGQLELLESRQRKAAARAVGEGHSYRQRAHLIVHGERRAHDVVVLPTDGASAGAAMDVTAIMAAQSELERQTSAYDQTLDRVETAVAIFHNDHRLTFWNEAYQKLWDLDHDWLRQNPTDDDILDRLREQNRLPSSVDHRGWKARVTGVYRAVDSISEIWHLNDGRVLNVICESRPSGGVTYLFSDQTKRIELESRYNALIDVQRETIDALLEGVAVFGTDGRLKLYNLAFSTIWGLDAASLAAQPHIETVIDAMRAMHQEDEVWQAIHHEITALVESRQPHSGQMTRLDERVIDYVVLPLPDGASLLTFADVTASKRAEQALVEKNDALVAADALKTKFLSHISYELRTPLTSIMGFADTLSNEYFGQLNPKQHEYVDDIRVSSKALEAVINDILDLTSISAGNVALNIAPVGIRVLLDAAARRASERHQGKPVILEISVEDDIAEVMADEVRMRQVLANLISNALSFSAPDSTVYVSSRAANGYIEFSVKDSGIGIPGDMLPRVYETFESHSHGQKHRGAGLGLSIAKQLVELHGGTIDIHSVPNVGTDVIVRLPDRISMAGPMDAATPAAKPARPVAAASPNTSLAGGQRAL